MYNICIFKYDRAQEILYNKYSESIKAFLEQDVKADLEQLQGAELLLMLNRKWEHHIIMVKWMQSFFQYLDRYYVDMQQVTKLSDQGFKIFKYEVFAPLCEKTTQAIIEEIQKQRNGEEILDMELLKGSVSIFLHLSSGKLEIVKGSSDKQLGWSIG